MKNTAKRFDELTVQQQEQVLSLFAPIWPPTEYLYEIGATEEVLSRRRSRAICKDDRGIAS